MVRHAGGRRRRRACPTAAMPTHPVGSFPHIPYYAIGCTLEDIQSRSRGRMRLEVIGKSALGRDMYGVVINRLRTRQEKRDYPNWLGVRATDAATSPIAGAEAAAPAAATTSRSRSSSRAASTATSTRASTPRSTSIEKFATTPYGDGSRRSTRSSATRSSSSTSIQNPDGRVAGTRANGNGFDLNRDYITQSQSETIASVTWMKRWLAPEMLDMHGYVTPTLIEATTKPHNPSIEYDSWLKWNQPRIDYNEAALDAIGQQSHAADQRLVPRGRRCRTRPAGSATTARRPGRTWPRAGTTGARSTARCTTSTSASTRRRSRCADARRRAAAAPGSRADPERRPAVDVRVRRRRNRDEMLARRARDLLPRRRRRPAAGLLPGPVQARVPQLDARLPAGVRDPGRRRASAATPRPTASSSGRCSTTSRSTELEKRLPLRRRRRSRRARTSS